MRLKPGIDSTGVHPVLWIMLGPVAVLHREMTGDGLVVTSLRRPPRATRSLHSPEPPALVQAADLRRWALDEDGVAREFCDELKRRYGHTLQAVLEPEDLTIAERAIREKLVDYAPHLHVELARAEWPIRL